MAENSVTDDVITFAQRKARVDVAGLPAGLTVLTLDGAKDLADLRVGERIITRRGARKLQKIQKLHVDNCAVVEIFGGALGHDRPEVDLALPYAQKVHLRDWRADLIFRQSEAAVEIGRLLDGVFVRLGAPRKIELYRLEFAQPEVVYCEGLELLC